LKHELCICICLYVYHKKPREEILFCQLTEDPKKVFMMDEDFKLLSSVLTEWRPGAVSSDVTVRTLLELSKTEDLLFENQICTSHLLGWVLMLARYSRF